MDPFGGVLSARHVSSLALCLCSIPPLIVGDAAHAAPLLHF